MSAFLLATLKFRISAFIAALVISSAANVWAQEPLRLKQLKLERFGTITLDWPVTAERAPQLVILFTKTETISESKNIAQALAHAGALVASLDWDTYVGDQRLQENSCVQFWDLERLGQVLQARLKLSDIHLPKLVGFGLAGRAALIAQRTYPNLFAGVLAIQPRLFLPSRNEPCEKRESIIFDAHQHTIKLLELQSTSKAVLVLANKPRSNDEATEQEIKNWLNFGTHKLVTDDETAQYVSVAFAPTSSPASTTRPIFVFASGDGGWAAIDRKITSRFAERGYGVIGINALKYFWRARTPAEFADFINQVVARQAGSWEYSGVVLAGFSLGAEVLPATLREAKPRVARNVVGMVLLNPSKFVEFEVHLTDWLSLGDNAARRPIAPDLDALTVPVLCILGEDEGEDSGCENTSQKTTSSTEKPEQVFRPELAVGSRISMLQLPGGHHFDEDYGNVADRILTWWESSRVGSKSAAAKQP